MNIALMANHFNTGGITSYLLNLSRGLVKAGHKVWVVSAGGNCVQALEAHGVRHVHLDIRVKSEAHFKLWFALPQLMRLVKEERIDVLHANTRVTQVLAHFAAKKTGRPFVSTCHGFFKPRFFRRIFPCWGAMVIAVSVPVRQHLVQDFRVDPARVKVILNGIDLSEFRLLNDQEKQHRRQHWQAQGAPLIGIIARLSSVKRIDVLVKAFAQVRTRFLQAQLWIVGEGPEQKTLGDIVRELGLTHAVRFMPVINQTAQLLPVFDVFVLPSQAEGLGLSVLEAQAAGVPVVVSDIGGLRDLVKHQETGLLTPVGDVHKLAENIIWMAEYPQQAHQLALQARRQVKEKFSAQQMVDCTIDVYAGVLNAYEQNTGY